MPRQAWPFLLLVIGLVTAVGCRDDSPPTWPQGAKLTTERAEKSLDVALRWPTAADDEKITGYELVRDQVPPVSVTPDQTTHTFEELADASEHTFSLRARDEAGNWSKPLVASLAIPDITPPTWPVARFDAEEQDLADDKPTFKLTWEPAADNVGVTGYLLTRTGSEFKVELGPEVHEHAIQGADIQGRYELKALDAAGKQSASLTCTVRSRRLLDRQLAINAGLLGLMKADRNHSSMFGSGGLRGALPERVDGAFGGLTGSAIGDSRGFGGLGSRGSGGVGYGSGLSGLNRPPEKVPGSVAPSVASTTGGIDASAFRRAIAGRRGAFKACYEKRLKQDPTIKGSLELTLTLNNGQITQSEITGGSLEDSGTRSCVRRVFRRIRLPGADGTVVTKFVFQKD